MMKRMLTRLLALLLSVLLVGGVFVACKNPPRDESKTTESCDLPPEDLPDYFDGKPYRIDYLKDVPGTGYCTACLVFNPNWTAEDFTVEIPEKSPAGDTVTHFKGGYHFCENYGVPAVISEKTYQEMIMTPLKEAGERGELSERKVDTAFYIAKFDSYFLPKDPMAIETEDEKEACIESYPITDPNGANIPIRVFTSDAAYVEILMIQEYLKKYTSFTKETIQSEYRYFRDEIRKLNPDDAKRDKMLEEFQFATGDCFVDLVLPKTIVEMDPIELGGYEKLLQHENGITYAGNCAIFADSELTTATLRAGTVCIASSAFSECEKLISVTIPDSVTSIGNSTFFGCESLTNITIPNSVTRFGNSVFYGCVSLVNITIPDSVMSIGKEAFYDCDGLIEREGGCSYVGNWIINCENDDNVIIRKGTIGIGHSAFYGHSLFSLTLPESIKYIGPYAFYESYYPDNLSIPDGVLFIDASAFQKCRGLTGITVGKNNKKYHSDGNCLIITDSKTLILGCNYSVIPSDGSVVAIGPYAFSDCDDLKNVTIPEGVTSIGEGAFLRCGSLSSIAIPDGITKINNLVFSECTNLTRVLLPDSITEIGDNGFSSCFILEEITIPKNVKRIGNSAFLGAGLKKIVIPNGVVYIGNLAFYFCRNLVHVTIPDSVTSIGDEAFSECNLLSIDVGEGNQAYRSAGNCLIDVNNKSLILGFKNSVIPMDGSVTSIGKGAFADCKDLVSITIPDSVTNIEDEAFVRCKDLVSIIIPDSVVNIGRSAFSECSSLMSVTLGNGVKSIDDSAFSGCGSLTSIVIPDSVTSIGEHAFYGCSGLANLTIGSSVTDIGLGAFKECINLVSITIPGNVTYIGAFAFFGCSGLTNLTIESSVTDIGCGVFEECINLVSITIPGNVTHIGPFAFFGCSSLTSIHYTGTREQWNAILKEEKWDEDAGSYIVHCIDGDISKN